MLEKDTASAMIDLGYFRVHELQLAEWERIYAPLNVAGELKKMCEWLAANPKRRKKNYQRFVVGWLNREHARIQRQAIEARAYAKVGSGNRLPSPEQHEENLRIVAELGG